MNGVIISWCCKKQPETALHSTGAKIRALLAGVMKTKILRQFSASIGFPMNAVLQQWKIIKELSSASNLLILWIMFAIWMFRLPG